MLHLDSRQHRWLPGPGYRDLTLMFGDGENTAWHRRRILQIEPHKFRHSWPSGDPTWAVTLYTDPKGHVSKAPDTLTC